MLKRVVRAPLAALCPQPGGSAVDFVASTTQPGEFIGAYGTGTATYDDIVFEDGHAVVFIANLTDESSRNITEVTVGGNVCTKLDINTGTNADNGDWYVSTSAITAGAHDIVVTVGTAFNKLLIMSGTLKNADPVPTATGVQTWGSAAGSIDFGPLTIPTDGLAVGFCWVSAAIGPPTCTVGTQVTTATDGDGNDVSLAKQTTNGANLTWTNGGHNAKGGSWAVFEPA